MIKNDIDVYDDIEMVIVTIGGRAVFIDVDKDGVACGCFIESEEQAAAIAAENAAWEAKMEEKKNKK